MNRTFNDLKNDEKFKGYIEYIFQEKVFEYVNSNILEIELTNKCSIGCFYCGASTTKKIFNLNYETLCNTIIHFSESRNSKSITPHFSFTGGDPLEYPHFEDLLQFARKHKLLFNLKLNPSSISEKTHKLIAKSTCQFVKLTFMGLHNQSRFRSKDTLEKLSAVTQRFKDNNIPVIWHFSIGEFNREDLLESLIFVLENPVSGISIGRLARIGRLNETNYPIEITPESFKSFLKDILLFFYNNKRNGFNLVFKEKLWVPFLIEEGILSESILLHPECRLGCDAKARLLVLTYAGELLPCGLLPNQVLATVSDDNFMDAISSPAKEYSLLENDPCLACKYLSVCRGCRGVIEGSTEQKDPQCWL